MTKCVQTGVIGIVSLGLLTSGCSTIEDLSLTSKLWNTGQLRCFAEPAPDPHLALFSAGQYDDVLVSYDEIRENNDSVRHRAYFLRQNIDPIRKLKKPQFVNPHLTTTMTPIPLNETSSANTNFQTNHSSMVAKFSKSNNEFTVLRDGKEEGPYSLPTYLESNGDLVRIAVTPLAVIGDTVMVGLVASFVAAYMYAAGTTYRANIQQ